MKRTLSEPQGYAVARGRGPAPVVPSAHGSPSEVRRRKEDIRPLSPTLLRPLFGEDRCADEFGDPFRQPFEVHLARRFCPAWGRGPRLPAGDDDERPVMPVLCMGAPFNFPRHGCGVVRCSSIGRILPQTDFGNLVPCRHSRR